MTAVSQHLGTTAAVPRNVAMASSFQLSLVLSAVGFAQIVVVPSVLAYINLHQDIELSLRGMPATAEVVEMSVDSGGRAGPTYHVEYKYRLADDGGRDLTSTAAISPSDYSGLRIGSTIPIVYDPLAPDNSAVDIDNTLAKGDIPRDAQYFLGGIGIILLAWLLGVALAMRRYRAAKRLLQWGQAAPARILAERRGLGGIARTSTVTYEFRDNLGQLRQGIRKNVLVEGARRGLLLAPRAEIFANPTVFFDPQDACRNILYPTDWVRLR